MPSAAAPVPAAQEIGRPLSLAEMIAEIELCFSNSIGNLEVTRDRDHFKGYILALLVLFTDYVKQMFYAHAVMAFENSAPGSRVEHSARQFCSELDVLLLALIEAAFAEKIWPRLGLTDDHFEKWRGFCTSRACKLLQPHLDVWRHKAWLRERDEFRKSSQSPALKKTSEPPIEPGAWRIAPECFELFIEKARLAKGAIISKADIDFVAGYERSTRENLEAGTGTQKSHARYTTVLEMEPSAFLASLSMRNSA